MSYIVDILRTFDLIAGVFAVISGIWTCVCLFWYFNCMSYYDFKNNREYQAVKKYLKLCAIILVVCLILCIFIPGDAVLKTWTK